MRQAHGHFEAAPARASRRALSEREKLVEIADEAARLSGLPDDRGPRRTVITNGTGRYRRSDWNLDALTFFPGQPSLDDPLVP